MKEKKLQNLKLRELSRKMDVAVEKHGPSGVYTAIARGCVSMLTGC